MTSNPVCRPPTFSACLLVLFFFSRPVCDRSHQVCTRGRRYHPVHPGNPVLACVYHGEQEEKSRRGRKGGSRAGGSPRGFVRSFGRAHFPVRALSIREEWAVQGGLRWVCSSWQSVDKPCENAVCVYLVVLSALVGTFSWSSRPTHPPTSRRRAPRLCL